MEKKYLMVSIIINSLFLLNFFSSIFLPSGIEKIFSTVSGTILFGGVFLILLAILFGLVHLFFGPNRKLTLYGLLVNLLSIAVIVSITMYASMHMRYPRGGL